MRHKAQWIGIAAGTALALAAVGVWRFSGQQGPDVPPPAQAIPRPASPPTHAPQATSASAPSAAPRPPEPAPSPPPLPKEAPTQDGIATVRVHVLSAQGGSAVAGATVALLRGPVSPSTPLESARTDADGWASFPAAHAGLFMVCARGPGHSEACEDSVGVVTGGTLSVELRLPPGATLVGRVHHPDGTPAAGVRLVAWGDEALAWRMPTEGLSDAQGDFRIDGVTPGQVRVSPITSEGQGVMRYTEAVEVGAEGRIDIELGGFAPVTVIPVRRGKEGRGDQVESVTVDSVPLTLQADGSWKGVVEAGKRGISVRGHRGFTVLGSHKVMTLKPGEAVTVRIPIVPDKDYRAIVVRPEPPEPGRFELAGHVVLSDGTLATGARVAVEQPVHGPCGNVPRHYSTFRFDGAAFVVHPTSTGSQTVHAWLEDGRAGRVTVSGKPGERIVANIRLEETGAVAGRLKTPSESRPDGISDIVVDDRWHGAWQFTARDGSFFVAGLSPGEHVLFLQGVDKQVVTVKARERTELGLLADKAP